MVREHLELRTLRYESRVTTGVFSRYFIARINDRNISQPPTKKEKKELSF